MIAYQVTVEMYGDVPRRYHTFGSLDDAKRFCRDVASCGRSFVTLDAIRAPFPPLRLDWEPAE